MNINVDIEALKESLLSHLESLQVFHFSALNPLFWAFLFILFLILSRFWKTRKSFSFCVVIAIVLLACSKLEHSAANALGSSTSFMIRGLSLFIIAIVSLYYFFIRND